MKTFALIVRGLAAFVVTWPRPCLRHVWTDRIDPPACGNCAKAWRP